MRFVASFSLALLATVAWGQEPLEIRNHRALSLPFLRLDPRAEPLAQGKSTLSVGLISANDLRYSGSVREDQETERLLLRYRFGTRAGDWTIDVPFLSRGGGVLDPLIELWHEDVLRIHNLRSRVPYGRSEVYVPGSGRFGSATGLGDVSAAFTRGFGRIFYGSLGLKLPTGDASRLLGSGGVDAAASIYARVPAGRLTVFGQVGFVVQGHPTELQGGRGLVDQESLSLAYRFTGRDAGVFQWQSERSALRTGNQFSDGPHRILSLGYQRQLSARDRLEAFFSEDGDFLNYRVPALVNVGPDFTVGVRWTRRW